MEIDQATQIGADGKRHPTGTAPQVVADTPEETTAKAVFDAADVVGYEQIADLDPAAGLTVPEGATRAVVVAEGAAVRYRFDDDPTATVGMPLAVGTPLTILGKLDEVKFIEQAATAKLNVTYLS